MPNNLPASKFINVASTTFFFYVRLTILPFSISLVSPIGLFFLDSFLMECLDRFEQYPASCGHLYRSLTWKSIFRLGLSVKRPDLMMMFLGIVRSLFRIFCSCTLKLFAVTQYG